MNNDSYKHNDYSQIQNEIMGDYQHQMSIDEPGNEIGGYVALEGRSLFAGDLDDSNKNDSVRRVIKHSKNSVFRLSSSSDATHRLWFTAGANYKKHNVINKQINAKQGLHPTKVDVEKYNSNNQITKTVTSKLKPNKINSDNTSPIDHFNNEGDFSSLKFDSKFNHPSKQYGIDIHGYINNAKFQKQIENNRFHQMKLSDNYKPIHVSQIQATSSDERRYIVSSHFGDMEEQQDTKVDDQNKNNPEDPNYSEIKEEQTALQEKINKISDEYHVENRDKIHNVLKTITTSSNEYRIGRTIAKNITSDCKDSTLSGIGIKIDMQRLNRLNEAPEYKKKSSTAYDGLKRRKRDVLK